MRVLEIDESAAPVVERIFELYLDGIGLKGIAETLNRDGVFVHPRTPPVRIAIGELMGGSTRR